MNSRFKYPREISLTYLLEIPDIFKIPFFLISYFYRYYIFVYRDAKNIPILFAEKRKQKNLRFSYRKK